VEEAPSEAANGPSLAQRNIRIEYHWREHGKTGRLARVTFKRLHELVEQADPEIVEEMAKAGKSDGVARLFTQRHRLH